MGARSCLAVATLGLLCLQCGAYSFLSCSNYDITTGICSGYPRKYSQWVASASHAYNLEANLPAGVNQNTTSVDPTLQNRTLTTTAAQDAIASPQYQNVYAAYPDGYQMASAFPGQNLTLTWPRTAQPDGDPVTSPTAWVYYYPNSSINAGMAFNSSTDPDLPTFQENLLATLTYNAANGTVGNCPVTDDSDADGFYIYKYDLSYHCNGQITIPSTAQPGVLSFLWLWRIEQPALYRLYPIVFEVNVMALPAAAAASATPASSTAG